MVYGIKRERRVPFKTKSSQIFSLCTSILTLLQKYNADWKSRLYGINRGCKHIFEYGIKMEWRVPFKGRIKMKPGFPLKCLNMPAFGRPFQKGGGRRPPKRHSKKTKSSQLFALCLSILRLLQKYNADWKIKIICNE